MRLDRAQKKLKLCAFKTNRLSEETSDLMGAGGDNVNFGALQLLSRPKAENPSYSV